MFKIINFFQLKKIRQILTVVLVTSLLFFGTACSEIQQRIVELQQSSAERISPPTPKTEIEEKPSLPNVLDNLTESVKSKIPSQETTSTPPARQDEEKTQTKEQPALLTPIEKVLKSEPEKKEPSSASSETENQPKDLTAKDSNPVQETIENIKAVVEEAEEKPTDFQPKDVTTEEPNPVKETIENIKAKTEETTENIQSGVKEVTENIKAKTEEATENIKSGLEEAGENLKQVPEKIESILKKDDSSNEEIKAEARKILTSPEETKTDSKIPQQETQPIDLQLRNGTSEEANPDETILDKIKSDIKEAVENSKETQENLESTLEKRASLGENQEKPEPPNPAKILEESVGMKQMA